jgi:hypothetical protein
MVALSPVARSVRVGRIAGILAVLAAVAGCGGKRIHLGDCPQAQVDADAVLWIGDSWILNPGTQQTRVRDLAREAGAIGLADNYVVAAQPGAFMADIAGQYDTRQADTVKVEVLIMDGGTWDTLIANGSDASVASAASAFTQFLAKVASDGTVKHVIYFLPPELPGIPGVAALRPLVQQACAQSAVRCHFLDLQPIWSGHPEYTEGIFPSDTGARVVADEIWSIMQAQCIAQ